ncbi:hypothetical protein ACHEVM_23510, partial [Roseomonas sp. SXEYE002]|nr:hypothetical protein [Roseomonas sp. SXEYE001]
FAAYIDQVLVPTLRPGDIVIMDNLPAHKGQHTRAAIQATGATIKAFHYPGLDALKAHVLAFITAYNFAKHLKALRWRTPFQAVCDAWTKDTTIFKINPHHLIPGPNT